MEELFMIGLGITIVILGTFNLKGDISTIHWYNRTKVLKENTKKYGKLMGLGTIIIGLGLFLTALLKIITKDEYFYLTILLPTIIGLIIMIYAQFKYNRGIF